MKVKELLSDESKWCIGSYAKDHNNHTVRWENPTAVRFCLGGAIMRCYSNYDERDKIFRLVQENIPYLIERTNDTSTFKEIKTLVERLDI